MKKGKKGKTKKPVGPRVRLPLPRKGEKRHGDLRKYDRAKEKERLRRERE